MLRTFVNGKFHWLRVTGLQPTYNGSCSICRELLKAAGIEPFERVEIYSLTSPLALPRTFFPVTQSASSRSMAGRPYISA
jgi:aspartate 1-decarboxylase